MKTKLSILATMIIGSVLYYSFVNIEKVDFILLETKSNAPIKNRDIEIYDFQMVYDAPPILNILTKRKTDNEGNFSIPKRFFKNREISIKCGDEYKMVRMQVHQNQVWLRRYRNGFSQVLELSQYDLNTKIETTNIFYKDSISQEFKKIKVFVNGIENYSQKLRTKLEERKVEFELDQSKLWKFIWNEFKSSVDNEVVAPYNSHTWYMHVVASMIFELDLKIAYQETKKVNDLNKMYYHFYALCAIINNNGGLQNESDKKIVDWIDVEVNKFYEMNSILDLEKKNKELPMDYLSSAYFAMKENLKK